MYFSSFTVVILFVTIVTVFAADTRVRYVHLAMTDRTTSEMNVGWYTQERTQQSVVEFSEGVVKAPPFRFQATGLASEWLSGYGWNHFVLLSPLRPGTLYSYRCGDPVGGWSNILTFTTPPASSVPFTVAVYGDMGIDNSINTATRVNAHAQHNDFDFVYHIGDISYADDHVFGFQGTWNQWFEMMENTTSIKPYMVLPGNHEYVSFDPLLFFYTRNFVVYNARFVMPGSAGSTRKNMYYSFDYSNVHFISYSTETSFPNAPYGNDFGDMYTWLEEDLKRANANRAATPWIIVCGHRPIYSSCEGYSYKGVPVNSIDPPSNSLTLQKLFEPLFTKYKVDLIFNGHVHSYERNYPAFNSSRTGGYTNPPHPVSIVIGNAGNIEGLEDYYEDDWTHPQPSWSAFRYGTGYGYGLLHVYNRTHLDWKFYGAATGALVDQVAITNFNH